jgi:hypothetical protein
MDFEWSGESWSEGIDITFAYVIELVVSPYTARLAVVVPHCSSSLAPMYVLALSPRPLLRIFMFGLLGLINLSIYIFFLNSLSLNAIKLIVVKLYNYQP